MKKWNTIIFDLDGTLFDTSEGIACSIQSVSYTHLFCCGLGLFLAQANVFFRDIQYIYNAVTTAWMYLTPIFYPIESIPSSLQIFIKTLNPLY